MTDQQRWDALGCYGNPIIQTPNLDRMAESGVRVDQAFTPIPLCVPSRVSTMSGRYPSVTRSRNNHTLIGDDEADLAKLLRDAGYRLALAGKNHCFHPDVLATWDFVYEEDHMGPRNHPDAERLAEYADERKRVYRRHAVSSEALPFPKEEFGTARITQHAEEFLNDVAATGDPFFLWLSYPDPHPPYVVPEEMDGMYDPQSIPLPPAEPDDFADKPLCQWITSRLMALDEKGEDELRRLIARYYTAVSFIDEGVGRILDTLHRTGLSENTLVIFTSDHGDFCGEHNCTEKGPALYDALIRVPLIFYAPGRIWPNVVSDTMVESIDVFPTILDYLGIETPVGVQGKSLRALLEGERTEHKDEVFAFVGLGGRIPAFTREEAAERVAMRKSEFDHNPEARFFRWIAPERESGPAVMIRTQEWKLVHYMTGEGELYDLRNDPGELTNLYGKPEFEEVVNRLYRRLVQFLLGSLDQRPPSGFDPTLHASGRVRV